MRTLIATHRAEASRYAASAMVWRDSGQHRNAIECQRLAAEHYVLAAALMDELMERMK